MTTPNNLPPLSSMSLSEHCSWQLIVTVTVCFVRLSSVKILLSHWPWDTACRFPPHPNRPGLPNSNASCLFSRESLAVRPRSRPHTLNQTKPWQRQTAGADDHFSLLTDKLYSVPDKMHKETLSIGLQPRATWEGSERLYSCETSSQRKGGWPACPSVFITWEIHKL